jgi:hypothetical protein
MRGKVILILVALATLLCITGGVAQRNRRIASFHHDKVAQRRHYRVQSLSSNSLISTFDNAIAARLWLLGGDCPAVALRYTAGYASYRRCATRKNKN